MANYKSFEDMPVWAESRELMNKVYSATKKRQFNDYTLREQMRRAAISVMSNIGEGFERKNYGKKGDVEFARFLTMAKGSSGEIRAQLYAALDQKYINNEVFNSRRSSSSGSDHYRKPYKGGEDDLLNVGLDGRKANPILRVDYSN